MGLLLLVAVLLGGCTVTSFLGRQYTNFTAYYNKFYNAQNAFEKGLKTVSRNDQAVDRTRYLSIFREPNDAANASGFEKAIQKSADVLREHPNSKWVDDALLLIGKSYFYQRNDVGAAQKFREVIAIDGERSREARFWLARTLLETGRYEEVEEVIRGGVQEGGSGPWVDRLHLVRGKLYTKQKEWEQATEALNRGLQGNVPDRIAARAAFLLGQSLETTGKVGAARTAYREVQGYDPPYALAFAARLSNIELQGQHDSAKRALERLADLEDDEKNYEQRGEMAVVRARIYRAQGQHDRARQILARMLYRSDAPSGESEGRLHYELARLYRDAYKDFSQAAAHFDTASTSLRRRGRQGEDDAAEHLPEAPSDVVSEADRYRDLAERAKEVARLDSLLRVGRMSDAEFQRFVADLRRKREAEKKARAAARQEEQSPQLVGRERALLKQRRGTAPAANTGGSDAGFLFHKDPARVQQGKRQFEQTWGDRPLVDNWRRRSAIRSGQTASSDGGEQNKTPQPSGSSPRKEASAPKASTDESTLDLSAIPRDSASQAKMESERAVMRYKLANSLFLAAGRPDSAATWYRRILQESGDHPVAKRALYALAEAYRAQGDTTAAQQAYRRLVDRYPDTDLAARARERLGRPRQARGDDRATLADSAYSQAYERWQAGELEPALSSLLDVATQYSNTDAAPRALLAAGLVYWKEVQQDSTTEARHVLERHLESLQSNDSTMSASDSSAGDSGKAALASSDSSSVGGGGSAAPSPAQVPSSPGDPARRDTPRTVSVGRPPDSTWAARPDSARAPSDSVTVAEETSADSSRQATSVQSEPDPYAPLDSLLSHLTKRYPDAPQVQRARTILEVIDEKRPDDDAARSDTSTRKPEPADTTRAAPRTIAQRRAEETRDSLAQAQGQTSPEADRSGRRDEDESEANRAGRDALPAPSGVSDRPNEPSQGGINRLKGGWTLRVQTFSSAKAASTQKSEIGRRVGDQWPVDVLKERQDGGPTKHHVVVGQFEAEQAAKQAKKRVARQLSSEPTVWAIPEPAVRP